MTSTNYPYNEYRDLYLEILKKAEKEADRTLVQMIARRLKEADPGPTVTEDGCQVFAFPTAAPSCEEDDQDRLFWKNSQFWQDLVQFMALLGVGISWFIFFCSLLTRQITS